MHAALTDSGYSTFVNIALDLGHDDGQGLSWVCVLSRSGVAC